jgi:hypothetical protein
MPWIANEDMALKFKLQGLTVSDANMSNRPVPVRYRLPEDELATLTYPSIIIEHIGFFPDPSREHRGYCQLPYAPEGYAPWWPAVSDNIPVVISGQEIYSGTYQYPQEVDGAPFFNPDDSPYWSYFPLPYNFDYRVTIYCRKMLGHLQPLMAQLATEPYLPYHFGYLNVPQDGTIRTMLLMGGPEIEYGKDKDDKRLFRATYMVRVCSEIVPTVYQNVPVEQINLDLGCYSDPTDITTEEMAMNRAILTTGPQVKYNVGVATSTVLDGQTQPRPTVRTPSRRPSRATKTKHGEN